LELGFHPACEEKNEACFQFVKRYNFVKPSDFLDPQFSSELLSLPDDGLAVTTAEPWVRNKVQLIRQHLLAFTATLADQVDELVFVDLYARNGLFCLGEKKDIFPGVSMMALQQDLPFTKYVLCEEDPDQFRSLKIRTNKYFKGKNIVLLNGKPTDLIGKLKMYVPAMRKNYKVAVICVADSFALAPPLETLHELDLHGFSFIIPLTFHLGPKIDYRYYLGEGKEKLKGFLGFLSDTEGDWKADSNALFYKQLVHIWKNRLQGIGLTASSITQRMDSGLMEIPTYQTFLITSRYSARSLQTDALSGSHPQFSLFNQN